MSDKNDPKPKSGNNKLGRADYEARLEQLQIELNQLARWLQHERKRLLVLIEGRDTAGKGGVISAIADALPPRVCKTVALPKPNERESTQWYFQRYVPYLPAAGELVLFDRSWYNRAGVETVMGYCSPRDTAHFLRQVPVFERLLVDAQPVLQQQHAVVDQALLKYWLCVDQALQEERFADRMNDPLKRWKLSPVDLQARDKYAAYGAARDRMLQATHKPKSPWTLVDFNDQRRGRLTLIRHLLDQMPDTALPEPQIDFPLLAAPPKREHFGGPLKPIKSA
jgi:polyphosphate kinase 2